MLHLGGKTIQAFPGDTVIINPCVTHEAFTCDAPVKYRVIMFELLDTFGQNEITRRMLAPFASGDAAFKPLIHDIDILKVADAIFETSTIKPNGYAMTLMGHIYSLLGILFEKYIDNDYTKPSSEGQFQNILDYIAENYCNPISSGSISRLFGYSEAYFSRRFKTITGLRPMEYIKILRLEKARHLLKNTQDSAVAIALACGFPNCNYFLRCFKAHYCFTVGEYRKQFGSSSQ